jgi:hypothetical protein
MRVACKDPNQYDWNQDWKFSTFGVCDCLSKNKLNNFSNYLEVLLYTNFKSWMSE